MRWISPTLTSVLAFAVLMNGLPRMSGFFALASTFNSAKSTYGNKQVSDFDRHILHNTNRVADRLLGQLQGHCRRIYNIDIEFVKYLLRHDSHACPRVIEGVVEVLHTIGTLGDWSSWMSLLFGHIIEDGDTAFFHQLHHLGGWHHTLVVEDVFQVLGICRNLHSVM